jgi:phospholipid-translocating ATPase
MGKEAYDDYKRNLRDREANSARYLILASHSLSDDDHLSNSRLEDNLPPTRSVPSSSIRVGDLVLLEKNQRVPADLVLLRTSDSSGTCFIRTDQLDGETDWKLRVAVPATQKLPSDQELLNLDAEIYGTRPLSRNQTRLLTPLSCISSRHAADAPTKDIHAFVGTFTINTPLSISSNEVPMVQVPTVEPLSAENVLWTNTVLASGNAIGFVVYTGLETRAVMNTSHPQTKVGLLDLEINKLAKVSYMLHFPLGSCALIAWMKDFVYSHIRAIRRAGCA